MDPQTPSKGIHISKFSRICRICLDDKNLIALENNRLGLALNVNNEQELNFPCWICTGCVESVGRWEKLRSMMEMSTKRFKTARTLALDLQLQQGVTGDNTVVFNVAPDIVDLTNEE